MLRLGLAALTVVIAGCSGPSPLPTDATTGLPILVELPAFPGSATALEWQQTSEPADGLRATDTTHDSIGELVAAMRSLAAESGAEVNVGFLGPPSEDAATLVIHSSSPDADFAGQELVAEVRRNDRGWHVDLIRYRHHCRREVRSLDGGCG